MATEASLILAIDARKAIAALRTFEHRVDKASASVRSLAGRVRNDFAVIGRAAGLMLAPLKLTAGVMATAKVATMAFGASCLQAAGRVEMMGQMLRTVIADQKMADRAFRESLEFSVSTPFEPKDIIDARIALEAVGVRGKEAVEKVAIAAAALNRNILDVASAVKSLESEPIRNLGMTLRTQGQHFELEFTDRMNRVVKVAVEGRKKAQEALLEAFSVKFGGKESLGRMSLTYEGLVSTLQGVIWMLRATFGTGLLDPAKLIVKDLIDAGTSLMDSAKTAGETFGEKMMYARAAMLAGFDVARKIAGQIGTALQQEGGVGFVILESLRLGAVILGEGLIQAFRVSLSMWKTIGVIVGQGVLDALFRSGIPGADMARGQAIKSNLSRWDNKSLQSLANRLGVDTKERASPGPHMREVAWETTGAYLGWQRKPNEQLAKELTEAIVKMPIEQQLEYAHFNPEEAISRSMKEAGESVRDGIRTFGETAHAALQQAVDNLTEFTGQEGMNVAEEYRKAFNEQLQSAQAQLDQWRAALNAAKTPGANGGQESGKEAPAKALLDKHLDSLRAQRKLLGMTNNEREKQAILDQAAKDAAAEKIKLTDEQTAALEREIDALQRARQIADIGQEIGYGFARGMSQAARYARNLNDVLDYLKETAADVLQRVMEILVWEPMAQNIATGFTSMFLPIFGSAKGNVFDQGRIVPFGLGGVFDRPTLFPLGMAGEAGPEAIMPLRRGSGGRLGVEASVQPVNLNVQVVIEDHTGNTVAIQQKDVRREGETYILTLVARNIVNDGIVGGAVKSKMGVM